MAATKYDAIIIPGGGVNSDGSLPASAVARLEMAAWLYGNDSAKHIIVCGSHGYKSVEKPAQTEAQAYANFLVNLGIPADQVYLETASQDTLGNILFVKINILLQYHWRRLLVIPSENHSTERVSYLLAKILGPEYVWDILRVGQNTGPKNLEREAKALRYTKEINDRFADGDHASIYKGLMETHPAYGGSKWTVDELRKELGS